MGGRGRREEGGGGENRESRAARISAKHELDLKASKQRWKGSGGEPARERMRGTLLLREKRCVDVVVMGSDRGEAKRWGWLKRLPVWWACARKSFQELDGVFSAEVSCQ